MSPLNQNEEATLRSIVIEVGTIGVFETGGNNMSKYIVKTTIGRCVVTLEALTDFDKVGYLSEENKQEIMNSFIEGE